MKQSLTLTCDDIRSPITLTRRMLREVARRAVETGEHDPHAFVELVTAYTVLVNQYQVLLADDRAQNPFPQDDAKETGE